MARRRVTRDQNDWPTVLVVHAVLRAAVNVALTPSTN